ncbi:MAG: sulfide-dependent adenosine diphosphate thiazole synthase [Acidobacteriota bacterium]|jgi:thiamine thiazole synthase|nr:sulfide-dependent adenosine diphosphate thiazole synthase [Acidobacteriota bacterium]
MELDDIRISRAIIERWTAKLLDSLELDVALVGGGPSNLVCGIELGRLGFRAAVFESKLSPGGGMWGGGMMFNELVVQESALHLLDRLGIHYREYGEGYYTADSVEATAMLIALCVQSGTPIFNLIHVEDVMFRETDHEKRVSGLVLNWSPVTHLGLHVDPLTVRSRFVVDGTGHDAEVCAIVARKIDARLNTRSGNVVGEMSMWAHRGEEWTIQNAGEVFPGLYVTGMAANAAKGGPRMGPVFGGMLLSGEKIAAEMAAVLRP